MRILLFTGKGGVGKTTISAATALHLADQGHRVIVTSADPAHSLADALDTPLGAEPRSVSLGCDAQQLDARREMEANWDEIRGWLLEAFAWAGVDAIEAEELSVLPGFDEIFALVEIERLCASGRYDVVVVDCAPTAETLRLLSLPDALRWYRSRLLPASRRVSRVVGPVLSRLSSIPIAGDSVFVAGERLLDRLEGVRSILADPEVTSTRLVVTPERMVVAESRRTLTYLSLYGYKVDAVVVNRLLPESVDDPWFADLRRVQDEQLRSIADDFAPLPLLRAELASSEVIGGDQLRLLGKALWGSVDPMSCLVDGRPMSLELEGDEFVLRVTLPNATRSEVDVARSGDTLVLTVGPHRRNVTLADSLQRREVGSARLEDGELRIGFVERP